MSKHSTSTPARPQRTASHAIDQEPLAGKDRYDLERSILVRVKKTPRFLLRELFDFFQGRADCFPSNARISQVSGISPRNVQYLLRQLEAVEIVRAIEDLAIPSQRRLVLLEHPHALKTLKALGALPEWLARFASLDRAGGAKVAYQGTQKAAMRPARVASEACLKGQEETGSFSPVQREKTRTLTQAELIAQVKGLVEGGGE